MSSFKMGSLKCFLLAGCSAIIFCQHASSAPLSDKQIKSSIGGKTIVLKTALGSMPLSYSKGGRVTGDGSGTGLSRFYAPKESGAWWVKNNRMCQRFKTWYKGRTFCFTLESTGPGRLKWTRNDGYSGTAVVR